MALNLPILLKRSATLSKRPDVSDLEVGQPAVNVNAGEPGLFFLDSTESEIIKIGPCHVGSSAPNSSPPPGGSAGNSDGEFWLDTSNPYAPILKVRSGSDWVGFGYVSSNTIWVNPYGDDSNSGTLPQSPKQTIKAALSVASPGTLINVAPGNYTEDNPLVFPEENISIIGDGHQSCTITLQNPGQDLFHVLSGCCVENFTFEGGTSPGKSIMCFPGSGSGPITRMPLLKNCNNLVEGTVCILADGDVSDGDKAISAEGVLHKSGSSVGFKATNRGSVEAVNCTTVYADKTAFAIDGGSISLNGCKSVFGEYGLYCEGKYPTQEQSGALSSLDSQRKTLTLTGLTQALRPYPGQILTAGTLYYKVGNFNVTAPGSGYTSPPQVSVSIGTGPNAVRATGRAIIEGGELVDIQVIDPGCGIAAADTISVTLTGGGFSSPASATITKEVIYYTVESSSSIVGNSCTVTLTESIYYTPSPGSNVRFYRPSRISAITHQMEYVGCGLISPYDGGTPNPSKEVMVKDGGKLYYTSMNQSGIFSVGKNFFVNATTGEVYGEGFERSVLNISLPLSLTSR